MENIITKIKTNPMGSIGGVIAAVSIAYKGFAIKKPCMLLLASIAGAIVGAEVQSRIKSTKK